MVDDRSRRGSSRAGCSRTSRCSGTPVDRRRARPHPRQGQALVGDRAGVLHQPTNTGGGIGYGENNLFGSNQKLLLYAQIATGDSFFVGAWQVPSIARHAVLRAARHVPRHALAQHRVRDADEVPRQPDRGAASRDWTTQRRRAARLRAVPRHQARHAPARRAASATATSSSTLDDNPTSTDADARARRPTTVPKPGNEGWDVSNEWTLDVRSPRELVRHRERHRVHADVRARGRLGSATSTTTRFNASAYKACRSSSSHNLVLKGALDVGHHMPFQQEFTTGGTSMRGWLNNQFRGDFRALVERRVLGAAVHDLRAVGPRPRVLGLGVHDVPVTATATTTRAQLPPEQRGRAGSRRSRTRSASARGCTCGRS